VRKLGNFRLFVVGVAVLGVAAAIMAITGALEWAVALLALAVVGDLGATVLSDRRLGQAVKRVRGESRGSDDLVLEMRRVTRWMRTTSTELRATSEKVDTMQRRVVASIDAARLEAADRAAVAAHADTGVRSARGDKDAPERNG
jgi:hypothetical protein